jgi:molybdopterin converting factor subunit 1
MVVGIDDLGGCGGLGVHAVTMLLASGLWGNFVAVCLVACFGMAASASVGYALEMRVHVLYFGMLRERLGGGEGWLELREGAIVAEVLNVYRERIAGFSWDSIAVAVNQEYAKTDLVLKDGDEVALLPPVSGGFGFEGLEWYAR